MDERRESRPEDTEFISTVEIGLDSSNDNLESTSDDLPDQSKIIISNLQNDFRDKSEVSKGRKVQQSTMNLRQDLPTDEEEEAGPSGKSMSNTQATNSFTAVPGSGYTSAVPSKASLAPSHSHYSNASNASQHPSQIVGNLNRPSQSSQVTVGEERSADSQSLPSGDSGEDGENIEYDDDMRSIYENPSVISRATQKSGVGSRTVGTSKSVQNTVSRSAATSKSIHDSMSRAALIAAESQKSMHQNPSSYQNPPSSVYVAPSAAALSQSKSRAFDEAAVVASKIASNYNQERVTGAESKTYHSKFCSVIKEQLAQCNIPFPEVAADPNIKKKNNCCGCNYTCKSGNNMPYKYKYGCGSNIHRPSFCGSIDVDMKRRIESVIVASKEACCKANQPPPVAVASNLSNNPSKILSKFESVHSNLPSVHSNAQSVHSKIKSAYSNAPSAYSNAPSAHSNAPSAHSNNGDKSVNSIESKESSSFTDVPNVYSGALHSTSGGPSNHQQAHRSSFHPVPSGSFIAASGSGSPGNSPFYRSYNPSYVPPSQSAITPGIISKVHQEGAFGNREMSGAPEASPYIGSNASYAPSGSMMNNGSGANSSFAPSGSYSQNPSMANASGVNSSYAPSQSYAQNPSMANASGANSSFAPSGSYAQNPSMANASGANSSFAPSGSYAQNPSMANASGANSSFAPSGSYAQNPSMANASGANSSYAPNGSYAQNPSMANASGANSSYAPNSASMANQGGGGAPVTNGSRSYQAQPGPGSQSQAQQRPKTFSQSQSNHYSSAQGPTSKQYSSAPQSTHQTSTSNYNPNSKTSSQQQSQGYPRPQ